MKEVLKNALIGIVTLAVVIGLGFVMSLVDLGMFSYFAPKYKQLQHDVFKSSSQYIEGVADDLADYRFQMIKADSVAEKRAIADVVNHRFANYDESNLESSDLKKFLIDCKNLTLDDY